MPTTATLWATSVDEQQTAAWSNPANALGAADLTVATYGNAAVGAEQSLRLGGYGWQAAIGNPATVDQLTIDVHWRVSNASRFTSATVRLHSGGQVIATQPATLSVDTAYPAQRYTFTGITWAHLADLTISIAATRTASTTAIMYVDAIGGQVTYTAATSGTTYPAGGSAVSTSAASGTASARYVTQGAVVATSAATGTATARLAATGATLATSSATGTATTRLPASGTATATSSATGTATIVSGTVTHAATGTAAATSAASGQATVIRQASGTATSTSDATGAATATYTASGTAAASSDATGSAALIPAGEWRDLDVTVGPPGQHPLTSTAWQTSLTAAPSHRTFTATPHQRPAPTPHQHPMEVTCPT